LGKRLADCRETGTVGPSVINRCDAYWIHRVLSPSADAARRVAFADGLRRATAAVHDDRVRGATRFPLDDLTFALRHCLRHLTRAIR
jgi:hypothetical protein